MSEQHEIHGMIVKQAAIVDASIAESNRRPRKAQILEKGTDDSGDKPGFGVATEYSDDMDVKWTIKRKRLITATKST